ncbi:hypothetical protein [Micromonospora sp. WMMD1082]|uniref:hypothetical protein n=1 Tax=Micromonospora sp. WMMD1082 TaxID=3016104 RepID=UPI00241728C7|nr:hypothetical protein [Micromonospora sp. WMMD1082]MDG4794974.1 hypothetical protein [Micromonospora sp. WMMD1082]
MTASHHDDTPCLKTTGQAWVPDLGPVPPRSDQHTAARPADHDPGALLSMRATMVLLLAAFTGIIAGVLAILAGHSLPAATLVGGTAAGGALALFHSLIERP